MHCVRCARWPKMRCPRPRQRGQVGVSPTAAQPVHLSSSSTQVFLARRRIHRFKRGTSNHCPVVDARSMGRSRLTRDWSLMLVYLFVRVHR
jgi:hypothetical protein